MTSPPAPPPGPGRTAPAELDRAIGPWTLGANTVNMSLGAGVFALPALVAAILGPAAIIAYLICGLAIALVMVCFVEIGSQTTRSGGTVAYIEDAFGPLAGFVAWVVYLPAFCAAADAAIALVFVGAVTSVAPALAAGWIRAAMLVALFGSLAAINVMGVRHGGRLAVATTALKVIPLALVIVAGVLTLHGSALRWTTWPPVSRIGEAALLLFFVFGGAEGALTASGEIRDPRRTVPRAVLGGTLVLLVIYISVQVVSQGILGADLPFRQEAPLAAVAGQLFGPLGWDLIVGCTALATFGTLAGDMLASPRGYLPMAADGLLPARVGAVHPRFRTPYVAICVHAGLGCVLAVSGAFKPLAIFANGSLLLVYLAVCLAAFKLRLAGTRPAGAFRAPGGVLVSVSGAVTVVWLLAQGSLAETAALAGVTAAASGYYLLRRRAAAWVTHR